MSMDPGAVMAELAAAVGEITGLNVTSHPIETVSPPAAGVTYPQRIAYDLTYGRGMDKLEGVPVVVVVGAVTLATTRDRIGRYAAGDGERSIKARLEGRDWAACDTVTVTSAEFDSVRYGEINYLQATFYCDVTG